MGFTAALVVGAAAGNTATTILVRSMVVMIIAWVVGRVIGGIAQKTVDDHLKSYKRNHPIPDNSAIAGPAVEGDPAAGEAA